jgi:hypothetical protein
MKNPKAQLSPATENEFALQCVRFLTGVIRPEVCKRFSLTRICAF